VNDAVAPTQPYGDLIPTTARVLTWNVWGRFGPWPEREVALLRTLEALEPDVVALQEAWCDRGGQDQAARLAKNLGYHGAYGGGTYLAEDWGTGSGLLSRWPIERHEYREFPASLRPAPRRVPARGGGPRVPDRHLRGLPGIRALRRLGDGRRRPRTHVDAPQSLGRAGAAPGSAYRLHPGRAASPRRSRARACLRPRGGRAGAGNRPVRPLRGRRGPAVLATR